MPLPARTPLPSARGNNAVAAPTNIPALCAVASQLATLLDRETALIRAMKLHEILPQAMLFVRGENSGISHNPLESTTSDDVELGVQAFQQLLEQLAKDNA